LDPFNSIPRIFVVHFLYLLSTSQKTSMLSGAVSVISQCFPSLSTAFAFNSYISQKMVAPQGIIFMAVWKQVQCLLNVTEHKIACQDMSERVK
jgi:hypothetical protein